MYSAILFVAPMILVGRTALSVDIMINFSMPHSTEAFASSLVPKMFTFTASLALNSIIGTCLYAAA